MFNWRDMVKRAQEDKEEEPKGRKPSEEAVLAFFEENEDPSDEEFHDWAEENGYDVHAAEEVAYGIVSDLMHGGKSKGEMPPGIPESEIEQGIKVEKEHTPSPIIARKIVADHLEEMGKGYYPNLLRMEKGMEKMKKEGAKMVRCPITGKMVPAAGKGRRMMAKLLEKKGTDLMSEIRLQRVPDAFGRGFLEEISKIGAAMAPPAQKGLMQSIIELAKKHKYITGGLGGFLLAKLLGRREESAYA